MPNTQKLLSKELMMSWSYDSQPLWYLCSSQGVIQGPKVGGRRICKATSEDYLSPDAFSSLLSKAAKSFLPASLRKSKIHQDTLRELAKHKTSLLGWQSTILYPPPPCRTKPPESWNLVCLVYSAGLACNTIQTLLEWIWQSSSESLRDLKP